jgi:hypothetical protein
MMILVVMLCCLCDVWEAGADAKTARGEAKGNSSGAQFYCAMAPTPFGRGDDVVAKTYKLRMCLSDEGHVIEVSCRGV